MVNAVQLDWKPSEGASHYRVELISESQRILGSTMTSEPRVMMSGEQVPEGAAFWRVLASEDGRRWSLHIPAVVLRPEAVGPVSVVEWEPSGAPAYRVIVRDTIVNDIVLKLPVVAPPAHVGWSDLEASHPHTARVQEWRDGAWVNLGPYVRLATPAQYMLDPPIPRAPAMRVAHLVIIALSGRPPGGRHGEQRPAEWWQQRLQLLRAWTIPGVAEICDRWLVRCDEAVPSDAFERLSTEYPAAVHRAYISDAAQEALGTVAGDDEGALAVTHITAGDRPHGRLGAWVAALASDVLVGEVTYAELSFPLAAALDTIRGRAWVARYEPAPARTILLRPEASLTIAIDPAASVVDPRFQKNEDTTFAACLRAWPGPNALSPLHGLRVSNTTVDEVQTSFELAASEGELLDPVEPLRA